MLIKVESGICQENFVKDRFVNMVRIMNGEFAIRPAAELDYKDFNEIHSMVNDINARYASHILRHVDISITRELFISQVNDPNTLLLVVEYQGHIIGILSAEMRSSADLPALVPRLYTHISHLGVKEQYRGLGIGRALIEYCKIWAKKAGAEQLEVLVMHYNEKAISFYESCGLLCIKHIHEVKL